MTPTNTPTPSVPPEMGAVRLAKVLVWMQVVANRSEALQTLRTSSMSERGNTHTHTQTLLYKPILLMTKKPMH